MYDPTTYFYNNIYRGIDIVTKRATAKVPLSINSILLTSFHTSSILLIQTCVVYYEYVTN